MVAEEGGTSNTQYYTTKGALISLQSGSNFIKTIGSPNLGANPLIHAQLVAIAKGDYELEGTTAFCIDYEPDPLFINFDCFTDGFLSRWLWSVGFTNVLAPPRDYLEGIAIILNPDDTINVQQTQAEIDRITAAAYAFTPAPTISNPLETTSNPSAGYTSIGSNCSTCGNLLGEINEISITGGFGSIF